MIYLLIGVAIIALTNLGALSILTHYMDTDRKEKHQMPENKTQKKESQKNAKKRKRK